MGEPKTYSAGLDFSGMSPHMMDTPIKQNRAQSVDQIYQDTRPVMDNNLSKYLDLHSIQSKPQIDNRVLSDNNTPLQAMMLNMQNDVGKKDPFQASKLIMTDLRNPKITNQYLDRFTNHNDAAYAKLGFSPFRDNEKLYNEHTNTWDDFQRAAGQAGVLAWLGMKDAATWGALTDRQTAFEYERAMAIGNSSKGGIGGFTTNLFLNSGYTLGIIGEVALEQLAFKAIELGLTAATPVTGGASAVAAGAVAGADATRLAMAGTKLKKAWETMKATEKALDAFRDVDKARSIYAKGATALGKFVNPLDNTIDFVKTVDRMDNVGDVAKGVRGFAAFYRDIGNVRLAYGESSLEGGMVQNEITHKLLEEYKDKHGTYPDESEAKRIAFAAAEAGTKTTLQNAPLIYFSNKITLGALTRGPFRKLYADTIETGVGQRILFAPGKAAKEAKQVFKKLPSEFIERQKLYIKNPKLFATSAGKYMSANVTEGLQEVAQDVIAGTNKDFYLDNYYGTKGAYYNYLLSNMDKQLSKQGLETFMSGFLMQTIVGPVISTVGTVTQGKAAFEGTVGGEIGGKIQDQFKKIEYRKTPQKYVDYKEHKRKIKADTQKELDLVVGQLNDFYDTPEKYFSAHLNNLLAGQAAVVGMADAEKAGDKKSFIDFKKSAEFSHIITALKYGQMDNFIQLMIDNKKLSKEDIEADLQDGVTYEDYIKELDTKIADARQIKAAYDYSKERFANPYDPNRYSDPAQRILESARKIAWDDNVQEFIFNQVQFKQQLDRQKKILDNTFNILNLSNTPITEFNILFTLSDVTDQIESLNAAIYGNATIEGYGTSANASSPALRRIIKDKESRLEYLKAYQVAMSKVQSKDMDAVTPEEQMALKKAYNDYINYITEQNNDYTTTDALNESLQNIIDHYLLGQDAQASNMVVNHLMDPKGFMNAHKRLTEEAKAKYDNKNEELKKALTVFNDKLKTEQLFQDLAEIGVFIKPEDVELLEKGQVPVIYNIEPEKGKFTQVHRRTPLYKQALAILLEKYPNLKGLPIDEEVVNSLYSSATRRRDAADKRTYNDLALQYHFNTTEAKPKVKLALVLRAIIDSEFSSPAEKALAEKLLTIATEDEHVTFSNIESTAGKYTPESAEQTVIDARYAADNYNNDGTPIETIILKQEIARRTVEGLKEDSVFNQQMTALMQEAKDAFMMLAEVDQQKIVGTYHTTHAAFESVEGFVTEAMTNPRLQEFIAGLDHKVDYKITTGWQKFVDIILDNLVKLLKKPDGTVLNAALSIVSTHIDSKYNKPPAGKEPIINTIVTPTENKKAQELRESLINALKNATTEEEVDNIDAEVNIILMKNPLAHDAGLANEGFTKLIDAARERVKENTIFTKPSEDMRVQLKDGSVVRIVKVNKKSVRVINEKTLEQKTISMNEILTSEQSFEETPVVDNITPIDIQQSNGAMQHNVLSNEEVGNIGASMADINLGSAFADLKKVLCK